MKFAVFTYDGYGLAVAHKLLQEGQDVVVAQVQDQTATLSEFEQNIGPETDEQRERRLSLYNGILEKTTPEKAIRSMAKEPNDWFAFFDLNHLFRFAEEAERTGAHGNFPKYENYCLEIDREGAKEFVAANYGKVNVAAKKRFSRVTEAKKFLKGTEDFWVLKGLEEDARTVVPDVDDLELAAGQILNALEQNPEMYESAGFILEQRIDGALEFTPERIYYDGEPVATVMCLENKQIGAGNVGPMTDCAQDLLFAIEADAKINDIAFPAVVDEMAKAHRGLFFWDASLLVDPRSGKVYFGEFCSNRAGYNSFYSELAMAGSATEFFTAVAKGSSPYSRQSVGASTRIFNLEQSANAVVECPADQGSNVWLRDVQSVRGKLRSLGYCDTVAVATGSGRSVAEASKRCQKSIDKFSFEGAYYRPSFDFLSREYKTSIVNRLEYGLQKGYYSIGFGLGV